MASKEYWKKRAAREAQQMYEDAEAVAGELRKAYGSASAYLQEQARGIFEKFRSKYGLSEAEARRLLMAMQDSTSLQELLQRLQSAEQTEDIINLRMRLEAAAYQARLGRLEKIMDLIDQIIRRLFRKELGITTGWLENLAQQSYFRSIYGISQRLGFLPEFGHVSQEAIKKLLASAWSGESYSSRIWENTQKLARRLKEEFLVNLMTGRTDREMANRIRDEFGKGASNARRLVRTESNHVHTEMRLQGSEEVGIEEYIFLATLDLKTSKICRKMDGKRFKVRDRLPGTNCPPMHPWCRSTTLDYFGEEWLKNGVRSALDPVTGRRIRVPLSMTYEEWYEKYVKGREKEEQEKKDHKKNRRKRNRNLDAELFKKYKAVFGDDIPDTLEEFQKLKYNRPEEWDKLKTEKQARINAMNVDEVKRLNGLLGNKEVRLWYKAHDEKIPELLDKSESLENQARKAHELRNSYRTQARDLMQDQEERRKLDIKKPNISFEELMERKRKQYGLSGEGAYRDIIRSSTTTNKEYDKKAGI